MTHENQQRTFQRLRIATVATGFVVALAMIVADVFVLAASDWPTEGAFIAALLFGGVFQGSLVWFVTNAYTWLQDRLIPPTNTYLFAVISAITIGIGAWIIIDAVIDPPSVTADIAQQIVFALSLVAASVISAVSAAQRPDSARPVNPRTFLTGVDAGSADALTMLEHIARWTAILGGLALSAVLSLLVLPTAIPVAIASVCFIRFASTTVWLRSARLQSIVGSTLIIILIHFLLADQVSDDGIDFIFIPSAILFSAAGLFGMLAWALPRGRSSAKDLMSR